MATTLTHQPRPFHLSILLPVLWAGVLAGCAGLPEDGPTTSDILKQPEAGRSGMIAYGARLPIIDLTAVVTEALTSPKPPTVAETFSDLASGQQGKIEPGDYVSANIWEIGSAELFSTAPGVGGAGATSNSGTVSTQSSTLPEQIVDATGTISVPYAGRISIGGLSLDEAQKKIEQALRGKTVQPQVILSLTRNTADSVTVAGDDIKGGLIGIGPNANRVLDIISASGGPLSPTYQTQIKIIRGDRQITVGLQSIIDSPGDNIRMHPHDVLVVSKNPAVFTVLGAVKTPSQIQFTSDHVSLAQALGLAGGLVDQQADPAGVFVFRYVTTAVAARVCGACAVASDRPLTPMVYRLDMRKAQSLLLAQRFNIEDRDVLFISNAPKTDLQKFLGLVGSLTAPVLTGAVVARSIN